MSLQCVTVSRESVQPQGVTVWHECVCVCVCDCRVAAVCSQHSQPPWHPDLRRVAFECLVRMASALQGLDAAVTLALDALAYETAPLVR